MSVKIGRDLIDIASRYIGVREIPGTKDNPVVMSMLHLDGDWPQHDEVPWCSAFVNYCAWLLDLPRSKSLAARSWLTVGYPIFAPAPAIPGFDIAILRRTDIAPGPEVIDAPGHVGIFIGASSTQVMLLGGNQSNMVCVAGYPIERVLGIRRLYVP